MRVASLITLAATVGVVLLLPACGQKGPLYLPQDASLASTPASAAATEPTPAQAAADSASSKAKPSTEKATKR